MNKLLMAFIFSLFFILPFANAAGGIWGDLSDSPSAVRGTVTVDGSTASSSIEVVASIGEDEYKSVSCDSDGNYYVTVGGDSADTIDLAVCGISADTITFSEGDVQELDLTISTQDDGVTGCTCDGICSGENCVNPGSTGVCSSDTFYCDSDGTCEADFGETTTTCSADCSTSSGSSSSGGGSSGGSSGGGGGGSSSSSLGSSSTTSDSGDSSTTQGSTDSNGNNVPEIIDIFDEEAIGRGLLSDGSTTETSLSLETQSDENQGGFLTGAVTAGQNVAGYAKDNVWATSGIFAVILLLVGGLVFARFKKKT
ncbi:hypothetical protein HOC01_02795 [archaeon]|jgi:hypothetical protein|nr:hypothetical protein [archaeon]MBT6698181.1 hypothetical protein [archaeon]